MKSFKWKNGFYSNGTDAQKIGEELEFIERQGNIMPEHIVEYAKRHKESELYKYFEWDNEEASNNWRLQQARTIICNIELGNNPSSSKVLSSLSSNNL